MADYKLAGHDLETPLLNAAGSINGTSEELILRDVATLARTAIGAITFGSITVQPQAGNEARLGSTVYHHDVTTGVTFNAMGLPNIGLDAAKRLLPEIISRAHEHGKPVIVSVSPTLPSIEIGDTFKQSARLVGELLETDTDLIKVNVGCPNIMTDSGTRKPILGYDLGGMRKLNDVLVSIAGSATGRIGIKLPPYLAPEETAVVPQLAQLFQNSGVLSFIVTANTLPVESEENAEEIKSVGGRSGPATREVGRGQLQLWHKAMGDDIDIVSTLGMHDGHEMAKRRDLGAAAVSGVTFLWESNDWGKAVTDMISEWLEHEAVTSDSTP